MGLPYGDAPQPAVAYLGLQSSSPNAGKGLVGRAAGGCSLSGTTILQSGYPFTVDTTAPFEPVFNASGQVTGMAQGSGDYNADEIISIIPMPRAITPPRAAKPISRDSSVVRPTALTRTSRFL